MALTPPRIVTVDRSDTCSLTGAKVTPMTKAYFEGLGKVEDLQRMYASAAMLNQLGVKQNTLFDLLYGRLSKIKVGTKTVDNKSMILPYVTFSQKTTINNSYFTLHSSSNTAVGAGSGDIPAHAHTYNIKQSNSRFVKELSDISQEFLPGQYLYLNTKGPAGTAVRIQVKIISAVAATVDSTPGVTLVVVPPLTAAGFASLSSDEKAIYAPEKATVTIGVDSTLDLERRCEQEAAYNNKGVKQFWLQTSREGYSWTEEFEKVLKHGLNEYFRNFGSVPLADQIKQMAETHKRKWVESVFHGAPLSELQIEEGFTDLEVFGDVRDPSCELKYKANAIGIITQLEIANRTFDNQGLTLNLDTVIEEAYFLSRTRADKKVDLLTDDVTRDNIKIAFGKYFKEQYNHEVNTFYKLGEQIRYGEAVWADYDCYKIARRNIVLNVFSHDYFVDRIDQTTDEDLKTINREIWLLDFTDVTIGIAGTKSVLRKYDSKTQADYQCVIDENPKTVKLMSKTWTVIVGDTDRHLVIKNFADEVPTITVRTAGS